MLELLVKAYAQPKNGGGGGGTPSAKATDDDKRYTDWSVEQARNAGISRPRKYVMDNVRRNSAPQSRARTMGQINRRG